MSEKLYGFNIHFKDGKTWTAVECDTYNTADQIAYLLNNMQHDIETKVLENRQTGETRKVTEIAHVILQF